MDLTDTIELIEKAENGDVSAFGELVDIYSARIYRIAYRMVGNEDDARDIAQEVFIRLYRTLNKYNPEYLFSTWLYRLTVNISIDYQRKNARHKNVEFDDENDSHAFKGHSTTPDIRTEQKELRSVIDILAAKLTLKQRQVFILRDIQDLSTGEVADVMRCREATVRVHLAKARYRIKNLLMKHYPELVSNYTSTKE